MRNYYFNMIKNPRIPLFFMLCTSLWLAACVVPSHKYKTTQTGSYVPQEKQAENPKTAPAKGTSKKEIPQKTVRVLLAGNQKSTFIKHSGRIYIYTQNLEKKYKITPAGELSIKALGNGQIRVGTLETTQTVVIEPAADTVFTWNKHFYSGRFFIIPKKTGFHIVEYAPLETYLYGVLPYEMNHAWPVEALKAQAVAARTYTLKTLEDIKRKDFDVYSDVRNQVYKGGAKQYASVQKAVDETRGEVLTYDGKLFYTYYHANCGGGTDDVRSWDRSATSIKPLSGSSCKTDTRSVSYSWKKKISHNKVLAYAKKAGLTGTLKSIKVSRKTHTGRSTHLTIKTSSGTKTVPCANFRLATGILSCKIEKIVVRKQDVYFEGKGFGHGVGMCQDGAHGMAREQKDYRKILKNYYPGAKITDFK